jgi:hypothetical protein
MLGTGAVQGLKRAGHCAAYPAILGQLQACLLYVQEVCSISEGTNVCSKPLKSHQVFLLAAVPGASHQGATSQARHTG